jgi:hypothetical protein
MIRQVMKGKDWTDEDAYWKVDLTEEMRQQGGMSQFNIKFADWAGGVSSNKIYGGTPTLDFLGKPQNIEVQDPTSLRKTLVPYTLPTSYGSAWSTGGSEFLDPTALGTSQTQKWGQPAGMRTAGFPTGYGGKWIMPGIYGQDTGFDAADFTTNLLGYGLPTFLADVSDEKGVDS